MDPSLQEEAAADGSLTLVLNPHGEICAVQKADGVGLDTHQLMTCVRLAGQQAIELNEQLNAALKAHEVARVAARVRRRAGGAAGVDGVGGADGRHVVVLRDVGQADARLEAMMRGEWVWGVVGCGRGRACACGCGCGWVDCGCVQ